MTFNLETTLFCDSELNFKNKKNKENLWKYVVGLVVAPLWTLRNNPTIITHVASQYKTIFFAAPVHMADRLWQNIRHKHVCQRGDY